MGQFCSAVCCISDVDRTPQRRSVTPTKYCLCDFCLDNYKLPQIARREETSNKVAQQCSFSIQKRAIHSVDSTRRPISSSPIGEGRIEDVERRKGKNTKEFIRSPPKYELKVAELEKVHSSTTNRSIRRESHKADVKGEEKPGNVEIIGDLTIINI